MLHQGDIPSLDLVISFTKDLMTPVPSDSPR